MPPQQTEPASESGSDAAVFGPGLTIGLVKATADAFAETSAAGPMAVPARNVVSWLKRCWNAFGKWQRERSRTSLYELSDRALMDIGVTRGEIDHIAPHRAINALRDSIHSRGMT